MHAGKRLLLSLVVLCTVSFTALADVTLPAVINENMVLQRERKVPIWGKAGPGEVVTVEMEKHKASATADKDGKWKVEIGPFKAGGPYEMTISGNQTKDLKTLKNILVGEVWVCSGQSNMEWSVKNSNNSDEEIAKADFPKIRLFTVKKKVSTTPLGDCEGKWDACNSSTVGSFSAVGYFFGRELHKTMNVPIGLINTSWGGTPAEAWTSRGGLEAMPECLPILERADKSLADLPEATKKWEAQLEKWKQAVAKAKAENKPQPRRPGPPMGPDNPHFPAGLYNGMIRPIVPYGIQGAIWYQGESNAGRAYQYRTLFPGMIKDWRKSWDQGDFPFLFVQLANFMERKTEPVDSAWAELREAQSMTLNLSKTGQAVIIDIGEAKDIHPRNKQDVGKRLALAAQKVAYDKDIVYSGPVYKSMTAKDGKATLKFDNIGGGLIAKGGEPLKGFAIAGADKKFVWAQAKIAGDMVEVWNDQVKDPVSVRYAWGDNPECNLYNKEELPASPFRTDTWDGVTKGKN